MLYICSYDIYGICFSLCFFFFFKQKTAYEMRISDWSSDVCSSDLFWRTRKSITSPAVSQRIQVSVLLSCEPVPVLMISVFCEEIGRASCRERVCQYV